MQYLEGWKIECFQSSKNWIENDLVKIRPKTEMFLLNSSNQLTETGYIDTHMHLDGLYRMGGAAVRDYETAADNLIVEMDRYGVAKALVMPPPQNPGQHGAYDYRNLLDAGQKYNNELTK